MTAARKFTARAKKSAKKAKFPTSPVKLARGIPQGTHVLLAVRAGGRCEFAGCNKYVFAHSLTNRAGNFSEKAHIVAFSEDGPRGKDSRRPKDPHNIENLMLLCTECHKEIDSNPTVYPRPVLESYKEEHEARIHCVTGLGPDKRTTVVQLKSRIAGDAVDIPAPHIYSAISPRYPIDTRGHIIDLTHFSSDDVSEYYTLAKAEISREIQKVYETGMSAEKTQHISLFALAQIPLLMHLGRCLSNKIEVDLFQRHRTGTDPWKWPEDGAEVRYKKALVQSGTDPMRVALKLSLSGLIPSTSLHSAIDETFSVYEITVKSHEPGTDFLRKRNDLQAFRLMYRKLLSELRGAHSSAKAIHVFPAVPAPIAVACGHDLLPKVDPTLVVYDFVKGHGFIKRIEVNEHDSK